MNELQLQRLVIQAAKSVGGTGWKLSNKFLVGVPDLLICLPGQPISIWEAKLNDKPLVVTEVTLKLTPLQEKTLSDLDNAGGFCGVISFLRTTGEIEMNAYLYRYLRYEDAFIKKHRVNIESHLKLRRGSREPTIVKILEKAYEHFRRPE